MLHCSFSFVAAQLLVKMMSALQKANNLSDFRTVISGKMGLWRPNTILTSQKFENVYFRSAFGTDLGRAIHGPINASVGGNFCRTLRTIGPYEFPQEKVWTNDWSI